jgi:hypothetical protein
MIKRGGGKFNALRRGRKDTVDGLLNDLVS